MSEDSKVSETAPVIAAETPPLRVNEQNVIMVGETRVTLDTIVEGFQRGDTPEEIARNYDALSLGQVYQAIGYYLAHQDQVDQYLNGRRLSRADTRKVIEADHKPEGIRQRLLNRRRAA